MADVFISYARSTAGQASAIAEALRAFGYSVWRDEEIPAHRDYAEVITERLRAAKAVLVLWSADAVKSQWVRAEADLARGAGTLVQLTLDGAALPLPFNQIQCADLAGWSGDPEAPGWRKILASVAELAGAGGLDSVVAAPARTRAIASKPSIAVMPFTNLSNDPDQEYFVRGIAEEIVGSLSNFRSIFVIAAGSSLSFGGKVISPRDAARQLGVRYLLEGSVRKSANRVRISVNLIDAADGEQIWANRWDDTLEDVFALQDQVALAVAGIIEPAMQKVDMQRVANRPTVTLGSYDLYLRALSLFWTFRRAETAQSIELLDQALTLEPHFGAALAQAAVCRRQMIDQGWSSDPERHRREGLDLVERALRFGGDDAKVLALVANSLPGLEGSVPRAITLIEKAVRLNSGSAFVWLISGVLNLRNGTPDVAAQHLENAIRLDPLSGDNGISYMYLAFARFAQGRFDEALALFQTTPFRIPAGYAVLAATYGQLGQAGLARGQLAEFGSQTSTRIEEVGRIWFPVPEHRQRFLDGIAAA